MTKPFPLTGPVRVTTKHVNNPKTGASAIQVKLNGKVRTHKYAYDSDTPHVAAIHAAFGSYNIRITNIVDNGKTKVFEVSAK